MDNNELYVFIAKLLISFVVLTGFYLGFFRYKSSFNSARCFLLAIPLVALLSAMLTFKVLPAEIKHVVPKPYVTMKSNVTDVFVPENIQSVSQAEANNVEIINSDNSINNDYWAITGHDIVKIILLVYVLGVLGVLSVIIYQLSKVFNIRRWAKKDTLDGVEFYRSSYATSSFSFGRDIFVDHNISGEKLTVVLQHELAHINNYHYIDKVIIECMTALMWFNPFIWFMRKDIGAIHEFQSDETVLRNGVNVAKYKHFLYEEILGATPHIANGFNNSLIKKRFYIIMNGNQIKFKTLRHVLTIPVVCLLMAATTVTYDDSVEIVIKESVLNNEVESSFSIASLESVLLFDRSKFKETLPLAETFRVEEIPADQIREIEFNEGTINKPEKTIHITLKDSKSPEVQSISTVSEVPKMPKMPEMSEMSEMPEVNVKIRVNDLVDDDPHKKQESNKKWYNDESKYYIAKASQIVTSLDNDTGIVDIQCTKKDTRVTVAYRSPANEYWIMMSSLFQIRDKKTNDRYMIRGIENELPMDKGLVLIGQQNRTLEYTLIFPPLKPDVDLVDIVEVVSPESARIGGGSPWRWDNVKISSFESRKRGEIIR